MSYCRLRKWTLVTNLQLLHIYPKLALQVALEQVHIVLSYPITLVVYGSVLLFMLTVDRRTKNR